MYGLRQDIGSAGMKLQSMGAELSSDNFLIFYPIGMFYKDFVLRWV